MCSYHELRSSSSHVNWRPSYDILFPMFIMPRMQGYQASQKQNNGKRKMRKRNGKKALKTIIYFIVILDLLTVYHRATKTWDSQKSFYLSMYFQFHNMFDIKWQHVIHLRTVRFPFHTEQSPAKIQQAITLESAGDLIC